MVKARKVTMTLKHFPLSKGGATDLPQVQPFHCLVPSPVTQEKSKLSSDSIPKTRTTPPTLRETVCTPAFLSALTNGKVVQLIPTAPASRCRVHKVRAGVKPCLDGRLDIGTYGIFWAIRKQDKDKNA